MTANGSDAAPTSPNRNAVQALPRTDGRTPLLLTVRTAIRSRWDRAADHAGDGDQRQDVRERLEEQRRRAAFREVGGQAGAECGRQAEEHAGRVGAEWPPVAEDDRGDRDEAAAAGNTLVEEADVPDREIHSAERRQRAGQDDRAPADRVHVDADRVRRAWVLADRPDPQPDRRPE